MEVAVFSGTWILGFKGGKYADKEDLPPGNTIAPLINETLPWDTITRQGA
jgi:hypothetical protein